VEFYRQQFGRRLAEALKMSGRTQSWLAEKLDVKDSTVSRWVNGHDFPRDRLQEICSALKVPVSHFDPDGQTLLDGVTPEELARAVKALVEAGPVERNTVLFLLLGEEVYLQRLPLQLRRRLSSLSEVP
jgi:transcriptional regulator with XRE-family HTH domain